MVIWIGFNVSRVILSSTYEKYGIESKCVSSIKYDSMVKKHLEFYLMLFAFSKTNVNGMIAFISERPY